MFLFDSSNIIWWKWDRKYWEQRKKYMLYTTTILTLNKVIIVKTVKMIMVKKATLPVETQLLMMTFHYCIWEIILVTLVQSGVDSVPTHHCGTFTHLPSCKDKASQVDKVLKAWELFSQMIFWKNNWVYQYLH